ncbi:endonuclease MutS2 [Desulfoplanes formicivorans]|uniref:Endonuclease MutS2 n=1 Tax=Desulfoplanes formicivorans TaxID=1592317 RepID=A0A194AK03_9BACT|nr:Smr/MutS family protein [Desulfoplanes formicivorans]GAU09575.1 DNA mismatch repair protein MutS [Desulfoplanes formicivorans]
MDSRTLTLLDYPKVLELLSHHAFSLAGKGACRELMPCTSQDRLSHEVGLLQQALAWFGETGHVFPAFPELDGVLAFVGQPAAILDKDGLWAVFRMLETAKTGRDAVLDAPSKRFTLLVDAADQVTWPSKTWSGLKRCMNSEGELKDESSPGLYSVRQEMRSILARCTRKVHDFFGDKDVLSFLQDEFLTISADRYVLAVKSNFKGKIKGIVHDFSQTGETCYIEPLFLVELNNQVRDLKQEEREEERKVLTLLTDLVRQEAAGIREMYDWLVMMDVLQAKVRLAASLDGIVLHMEPGAPLALKSARHPLLALQGNAVVPVDIELEPDQKGLIVSGGNAGGKTVSLKTLGLIALMARTALPVPVAPESRLPLLDQVFVSMGDEQSLEESLSTFTAQIRHFARLWPHIGPATLVILDEFGMGTDPSQGAALAQAVVDGLLERDSFVAVATHFPALKVYGLTKQQVRAASVLFDPRTKKPLYKLVYDQVGASQALDVAREQGLDASILARAEEYLLLEGGDTRDIFNRLNALAESKEKELDRLKKREAVLEEKWARRQQRFERERAELVKGLEARSQEIVRAWRQGRLGRKQALSKLAEARKQIAPAPRESTTRGFAWADLAPGKRVVYTSWDKSAVVEALDQRKKRVKINAGGLAVWVGIEDLAPDRPATAKSPGYTVNSGQVAGSLMRLDLRGMRADEAQARLESFLDSAILKGGCELEIIHGKGTGVLKTVAHEVLQGFPGVQSFALANADEGGDGMTRVVLE